jgi:hypothetical protein
MDQALWGTDSTPSLPEVPKNPIWVDLGGSGFVFTSGGIAHNIDAATLEELATPTFGPMLPEVK